MLKIKYFIFLLFPLLMQGQNFQIDYQFTTPSGTNIYYQLLTEGDYSEFRQLDAETEKGSNTLLYSQNETFFVIKDSQLNSMVSSEFLGNKRIVVKDSLNIIDWVLADENHKKDILGMECSKAQTIFRGRTYTAYYAPEITIADGPWKFQGLPGLILEITSDDGQYAYRALKIVKSKNRIEKTISYTDYELSNWSDFKKLFISYTNNLVNYLKSEQEESGFANFYKVTKPEIIYEEAQMGDGIEY